MKFAGCTAQGKHVRYASDISPGPDYEPDTEPPSRTVKATGSPVVTARSSRGAYYHDRHGALRADAPCVCGHARGDHAAELLCLAIGGDCDCTRFRLALGRERVNPTPTGVGVELCLGLTNDDTSSEGRK